MARHRSPAGRSTLPTLAPPVHRRAARGGGVRQALILGDPLRRGAVVVAAAVTATGGFLAVDHASGAGEPVQLTAHPADAAAALASPTTTAPAAVAPPVAVPAVPVVTVETRPAQDRSAAERLRRSTEQLRLSAEKAAKERAQAARAEAAERAKQACAVDTSELGRVKAPVLQAAKFLGCRFHETEMFGVAGRGGPSDHPRGLAVDFMVDRVTGDALAQCVLRHQEELGVSYVIWQQRINTGSGWEGMEDRGDATANHRDHVHVSFTGKGGTTPSGC